MTKTVISLGEMGDGLERVPMVCVVGESAEFMPREE
jgi:hypothetical protein